MYLKVWQTFMIKNFEFFESLELKVRTLLSYENLQKHRKDLYKFAQNEQYLVLY